MSKESEIEDEEASIFKKLKKINEPNIQITFDKYMNENMNEDINENMNENKDTLRISNLENEMKHLNNKMDTILELLRRK